MGITMISSIQRHTYMIMPFLLWFSWASSSSLTKPQKTEGQMTSHKKVNKYKDFCLLFIQKKEKTIPILDGRLNNQSYKISPQVSGWWLVFSSYIILIFYLNFFYETNGEKTNVAKNISQWNVMQYKVSIG